MKFAVAALIANVSAYKIGETMSTEEYKFMSFVSQESKSYGTRAEYDFRLNIFTETLKKIEEHNSTPGVTSTIGINQFADRTPEEIKKVLGYKVPEGTITKTPTVLDTVNVADSIDWRAKGAVTKVKNQGQCGSCWSFSTTGAMEGAHFIKTGNLVSISEQNLVDCSWLNHGCNGGMMDLAFKYAESYPLETEAEYPYTAKTGLFACKYDKSKGVVKVNTYNDVPKSSSAALKAALNNGPVSVAIQADQDVFHKYTGGIITAGCGTSLDHGVLAVGYATDAATNTEYYIVKNSWTASWGEKGYVRIAVQDGAGQCGIQMSASYPETN